LPRHRSNEHLNLQAIRPKATGHPFPPVSGLFTPQTNTLIYRPSVLKPPAIRFRPSPVFSRPFQTAKSLRCGQIYKNDRPEYHGVLLVLFCPERTGLKFHAFSVDLLELSERYG
jgi:hypothetical protein